MDRYSRVQLGIGPTWVDFHSWFTIPRNQLARVDVGSEWVGFSTVHSWFGIGWSGSDTGSPVGCPVFYTSNYTSIINCQFSK